MYRGWGKIIAANGVAGTMVDFRNAVTASSVPEVAPFPAGLNDCVSGLRWVIANAGRLNIDPARVIVAGRSRRGDPDLPPWPHAPHHGWPRLCYAHPASLT